MKLDKTKPYGTVVGHAVAAFEQDGTLFDGAGDPINYEPTPVRVVDTIIETDGVESAKQFLMTMLASNPLSKSVLYKEAEQNNQSWEDVKKAFALLKGTTFTYRNATMWKLPADLDEVTE